MAPPGFNIFVDQSMRQPVGSREHPNNVPLSLARHQQEDFQSRNPPQADMDLNPPARYIPEHLPPDKRFHFDERKLYPPNGGELSFEEINFAAWQKRHTLLREKKRMEEIQEENNTLKSQVEALNIQLQSVIATLKQLQSQPPQHLQHHQHGHNQNQQHQQYSNGQSNRYQDPPSPTMPGNRLSIVPQSLQPTSQGLEYNDMSLYGAINEAPSVVQDLWRNTLANQFTVPIDQSQYFKDNVPTSTPTSKRPSNSDNENKKPNFNRRQSRPSVGGGSPTLKLTPITETSRDCNSKSSSSSSALSATPCTAKKALQLVLEPVIDAEPERPLDPNDPTTYKSLLKKLAEPLDRRPGFSRLNRSMPKIRQGACFVAGGDDYLVDKELSQEAKTFTAQLLSDDTLDNSNSDMPFKTVCFRVDQPANEWLFYICNELHKRLVKQKTKPDIELSLMIANPAVMYNDGSILVDEYSRFISLQNLFDACKQTNKPFPKSIAAYITLELLLCIRQIHSFEIIHMDINPKNLLMICSPTRDDISNVGDRTSIIKLIGFDRAMDTRLIGRDYKFDAQLDNLITCEMMDSKPWNYHVDWFGALTCIYKMFFLQDMAVSKETGKWSVDRQFKGFPTNVWANLFDGLLNIDKMDQALSLVDQTIEELNTWIKANISFVLKEANGLDQTYEEYCKANNRSVRN